MFEVWQEKHLESKFNWIKLWIDYYHGLRIKHDAKESIFRKGAKMGVSPVSHFRHNTFPLTHKTQESVQVARRGVVSLRRVVNKNVKVCLWDGITHTLSHCVIKSSLYPSGIRRHTSSSSPQHFSSNVLSITLSLFLHAPVQHRAGVSLLCWSGSANHAQGSGGLLLLQLLSYHKCNQLCIILCDNSSIQAWVPLHKCFQ